MFGITGDWAWSHMIRYGLEKTGITVFNPDPDLPSYPGRLELIQRAMVDKNGNESRAVPVLSMYEYLGLLLDEYGELAEHILQEVLPEVRRRLWARSSTIATHDILAPEASLRFIDSGVLSVARYSCAIWGRSRWFPVSRVNTRVRIAPAGGTRRQAAPAVSVATIRELVTKDERIGVQAENPKRSESMTRYERYKKATSVSEYLKLGGSRADLRFDLQRGYVWALDRTAQDAVREEMLELAITAENVEIPTAIGDGEVIKMGRNDGQAVADPRAKAQDEVNACSHRC